MDQKHSAAGEHLPGFITAPGDTDILFVVTTVLLIAAVLGIGNLYLRLHALPEHIAHRAHKVQLEIVAVLGLLALFTHNHLFWVAGLILAFVELPDFSTPIRSMAASLERLAGPTSPTPATSLGEAADAVIPAPLPSEAPLPADPARREPTTAPVGGPSPRPADHA